MKILVDARELEGRRTGVGRYLHETLRAWTANTGARQHQLVLCSSSPVDISPYAGLNVTSIVAPGRGLHWEQFTLRRVIAQESPALLLAPGYTAPLLTSVPTVLVVHDVSFTSHPEWFSWKEGARRRVVTRLSARRATRIVTVSNFSRHEIELLLGVDPSKIVVIPNGVTRLTTAPSPTTALNVLYVGSIFNRRHVPVLIEAVALLATRGLDVTLTIVGDNRTMPRVDLARYVADRGLQDRVTLTSYVSDAALATCYRNARAFAFLSEYEGFGLTPLEALAAGVPPVVVDTRASREVYGDAALFVDAPRPTTVADALERALLDEGARDRVRQAAGHVLSRHDWAAGAAHLLAVVQEVGSTR